MLRTKRIRLDSEFAETIERGRRQLQAATGKRITTGHYSAYITPVVRPLLIKPVTKEDAREYKRRYG